MEIYDEIGIAFLCIRIGIRAEEPRMHSTARDDRQKHVALVQLSTIDTRRRGPDSRAKTLLDSVHACICALYVNMHSHHFDITSVVQKACVSGSPKMDLKHSTRCVNLEQLELCGQIQFYNI